MTRGAKSKKKRPRKRGEKRVAGLTPSPRSPKAAPGMPPVDETPLRWYWLVGLLIAVPAAVGIKLLTLRGLDLYKASDLYRGAGSGDAG